MPQADPSAEPAADPRALIPRTAEQAQAVAAALGLTVPEACLPGVLGNLALLAGHADSLLAPPVPPVA